MIVCRLDNISNSMVLIPPLFTNKYIKITDIYMKWVFQFQSCLLPHFVKIKDMRTYPEHNKKYIFFIGTNKLQRIPIKEI